MSDALPNFTSYSVAKRHEIVRVKILPDHFEPAIGAVMVSVAVAAFDGIVQLYKSFVAVPGVEVDLALAESKVGQSMRQELQHHAETELVRTDGSISFVNGHRIGELRIVDGGPQTLGAF